MKKIILLYLTICLSFPVICMELTSKERELFQVIEFNNIAQAKRLVDENHTIDIPKILTLAIEKNNIKAIQFLIKDAELNDLKNALIQAIHTENSAIVKTVLDGTLRISIDQPNGNGDTPLIHAVKTHNIKVIEEILTEVPNPNIKNSEALKLAKTEQEKKLIEIAEKQFNLFNAIKESRSNLESFITPEILKLNILSNQRNPLAAAIDNHNLNAVKLLVNEGKKTNQNFVNQTLKGGITPLLIAVYKNQSDIVEFLLAQGANPNTPPDKFLNNTPLLWAIKNNNNQIIQLLLDHKANVNYQVPSDNTTLLMIAAAIQVDVNAVKKLLELGADPFMKNSEGKTALDLAQELYDTISDEDTKNSYAEIIRLLKEKMPIIPIAIPSTNQPLIQLLDKFTQLTQALQQLATQLR